MAFLILKSVPSLFSTVCKLTVENVKQVRTKYTDKHMKRDVKRRKMFTEYAPERLRVNALRRNTILPAEIKALADAEMDAFPRDSRACRYQNRCVVTSRGRGVVVRWRLSRIMFRHLADYNKLAGIERAMW